MTMIKTEVQQLERTREKALQIDFKLLDFVRDVNALFSEVGEGCADEETLAMDIENLITRQAEVMGIHLQFLDLPKDFHGFYIVATNSTVVVLNDFTDVPTKCAVFRELAEHHAIGDRSYKMVFSPRTEDSESSEDGELFGDTSLLTGSIFKSEILELISYKKATKIPLMHV